ncbi:adenosylcobinamide-phosphate synthase CbiB [Croceicoccus pelagius]|uniref:Cobalamin biosynthesis protein CobD n=1 Tax=Croceicoccus pelagius TaxID=1703341 RepID=A0A917DLN5_9SPHN|nr:adenosylcobinamide-phosphate synthase CbiB [Croceicoccus pelagius]GGD50294.1 cobalamin biosynthesis protein CobD [Croceicoccus pelagius]
MAEPIALIALALDGALGWPRWLYRRVGHPVGGFARIIEWGARRWKLPMRSPRQRRLGGIATLLLVTGIAAAVALLLQWVAIELLGSHGWLVVAILAFPAIAQRSLLEHVRPVLAALESRNLGQARDAVALIVGRDTEQLDAPAVSRAAIESLAESFCDGVIAPLFWLIVLGLPGVWAFKAISTADSMIGHVEQPWRDFGWAAARADDFANWLPARIAGALICLSGAGGWRTMARDHGEHASPNAGWPEAAMAGALGVWLAGPVAYDGVCHDKPVIGAGGKAGPGELRKAIGIYIKACALAWIIAGVLAWPV